MSQVRTGLPALLPPQPTVHGAQPLGLPLEHGLRPQRRLHKQLAPAVGGVDVGGGPAGAARKLGARDAPKLGQVRLDPSRRAVRFPAGWGSGAG